MSIRQREGRKATDSTAYIVVVNWNGIAMLQKCLKSLFDNTDNSTFKLVVVDNASTDGSVEMVQKNFPQASVFVNETNAGFSRANNRGIIFAMQNNAKKIMLLNNDVEITKTGWLEDLSRFLESDPQIGVVGCKLVYPNGLIQHAGGAIELKMPYNRGEGEKDTGQFDKVEFVDFVTGAALMIKSAVINKIGLLDEGFSPLYFEDTDWCVRAKLFGYKIAYSPEPTLVHHCGLTSKKIGDLKKRLYSRRSFIRFMLLNYQLRDIKKHIVLFESREFIRCFVVRGGRFPFTLRTDAYNQLMLLLQIWLPNIRQLKEIISLRRYRFMYGEKLDL